MLHMHTHTHIVGILHQYAYCPPPSFLCLFTTDLHSYGYWLLAAWLCPCSMLHPPTSINKHQLDSAHATCIIIRVQDASTDKSTPIPIISRYGYGYGYWLVASCRVVGWRLVWYIGLGILVWPIILVWHIGLGIHLIATCRSVNKMASVDCDLQLAHIYNHKSIPNSSSCARAFFQVPSFWRIASL